MFHYLSLHKSHYYNDKHDGRALPYSDIYSDCLLRLPMFYELDPEIVANHVVGHFANIVPAISSI